MSDVVGTIFTRSQLELQITEHIQEWMTAYIAAVEREESIPARSIALPKSWNVRHDFTTLPEDALPMVAVLSTGTIPGRKPVRDGDGLVRAWWAVGIGAVVAASGSQAAKNLAGYYGAAIRLMMSQDPSIGGWAYGCDWMDESYDDIKLDQRMFSAVRLVFQVEVHDVMNVYAGFRDPTGEFVLPIDPYEQPADFPIVQPGKVDLTYYKTDER